MDARRVMLYDVCKVAGGYPSQPAHSVSAMPVEFLQEPRTVPFPSLNGVS